MYGGDRYHQHGRNGRGRKRGQQHRQYFHSNDGEDGYDWQDDVPTRGGRGGGRGGRGKSGPRGRGRHPPELQGRAIGMYYACVGRQRREAKERAERRVVAMGRRQEAHIEQLLHNIRTSETCPPQPDRSGAEPDRDDWFDQDGSQRHQSAQSQRQRKYNYSSVKDEHSPPGRNPIKREPGTSQEGTIDDRGVAGLTEDEEIEAVNEPDIIDTVEREEQEDVKNFSELMHYNTEEDYMMKQETFDAFLSEDRENELLNMEMQDDFFQKQNDRQYKEMIAFRRKLPAFEKKMEVLDAIEKNQVVVISGETGCGKTTQVPQFILDEFLAHGKGTDCRIFCTQPRRISAVSVAERVAAERAEELGKSTGYMIRLEHKMPRQQGSILYCTTGIMLRLLETDPLLQRASHIVLDEIHERDLLSDFLIIILRDILQRRPDLKLILMSATLNAELFSEYFNNCPMLNIPGFTYPVEEYRLEDVIEILGYQPPAKMLMNLKPRRIKYGRGRKLHEEQEEQEDDDWNPDAWLRNIEQDYSQSTIDVLKNYDTSRIDLDLIHNLIRYIVTQKDDGAILTFVPGWAEISDLNKLLMADPLFDSNKFRIIPLHSLMPTLNQKEVFERPPPGVRKIVIATNIAETSITIDDVVYVIDGGRIKVKDYSAEKNMSSLASQWVSKANAKQRRGRAGRVQPGECYHLYTGLQEHMLQDYLPPEILRTRLEELCLLIKLLKLGRIEPFVKKAIQAPSIQALFRAIDNLQSINALDKDENLLPLGCHLARMPVDPHVGKMILFGAMFSCLDPVLTIASSLSFKDAFTIPLGKEKLSDEARKRLADGSNSDHILLVNAFRGWENAVARGTNRHYCWTNFLSESTLRLLRDMKKQQAELLFDMGFLSSRNPKHDAANINSDNIALVKAVLCAGLYPNVAKVKTPPKGKRPMKLQTLSERNCELHPKSVNKGISEPESQWVIFHKIMKTSGVNIFDSSFVSPYPLLFFGGEIGTFKECGEDHVSVDDWIKFKASPRTATLVKELREELDKLLEEKITNPGVTNWNANSKEGALLTAIINLVTTEEKQNQRNSDYDTYSVRERNAN